MAKRRKLDRSVTRWVVLYFKGKRVRTFRQRISVAAALRELGGDPLMMEGRLMTGERSGGSRACGKFLPWSVVRVEVSYQADHRPGDHVHVGPVTDLRTSVDVIRNNFVG